MPEKSESRLIVHLALAGFGVLLVLSMVSSPSKAQDQTDGKDLFSRRCGGCHALDRNKEGPRLGGVYGRTAGSVESFQYSEALKKSGIVWTSETLGRWLTDTQALVPNNGMDFHVEKAGERQAIIAFLKRISAK